MNSANAPSAAPIVLRPYQRDALLAVRDRVREGMRCLLLVMPTGSGKTCTFARADKALGLTPADKIMILAHRDELIEQARAKFLEAAPDAMVGIEKAERCVFPMDRVAVVSVQTLAKKERRTDLWRRWGKPRLVITDEAHHAVAPTYRAIYEELGIRPGGDIIHIGVTATPRRGDSVDFSGIYEGIAYSIPFTKLIEDGYLARPRAFTVNSEIDLGDVKTALGDFKLEDLAKVVDVWKRNLAVIKAYNDLAAGTRALVFAASVDHSKNLTGAFREAGVAAMHLDGTTETERRHAIIDDFRDGRVQVLCNFNLFAEGLDIPAIETIIIARPTKIASLYQQMVGRGLRLYPGKTHLNVIDVTDVASKHQIVNLPVLFDMPNSFDLQGQDAYAVSKRYKRVVDDEPLLVPLIDNTSTLDRIEAVDPAKRVPTRIREIIDLAKTSNTYVEADLLLPPPLPDELSDVEMAWIPCPDGTFRLRIDNDRLAVKTNPIGISSTWVKRADGTIEALVKGVAQTAAFAAGDAWVKQHHSGKLILIERGRSWRKKKPKPDQILFLKRRQIRLHDNAKRGDASDIITRLKEMGI